MEAFSLRPQDSSKNSHNCLLFTLFNLSALTIFLSNQTMFFINILQIIDRKLIFDTVFAPTPTQMNQALIWQILSSRFNHCEEMENNLQRKHRATRKWTRQLSLNTTIISLPKKSVFFETDCYRRDLWWNVYLKEQIFKLKIGVEVIIILFVQWGVLIYFQSYIQWWIFKKMRLISEKAKEYVPPDTITRTVSIAEITSDNL